MSHSLYSKDEIGNVILAAHRMAIETAKRAPSSVEMESYLDGFVTALQVMATALGIKVEIEHLFSNPSREWHEVLDISPNSIFQPPAPVEQNDD